MHNGHHRFPTDGHGQRRSSIHLPGFTPSQVTSPPDLALQAGSRSISVSNQAHRPSICSVDRFIRINHLVALNRSPLVPCGRWKMSYRCGVPNKSRHRPWNCRRRVRFSPCWQHGGGAAYSAPSSWWTSTASAAFIADVVTQGLHPAVAGELADRVTQYLGTEGKRQPRRRHRKGVDCELLAEAARAILGLKRARTGR
jgi:hypothetical protein